MTIKILYQGRTSASGLRRSLNTDSAAKRGVEFNKFDGETYRTEPGTDRPGEQLNHALAGAERKFFIASKANGVYTGKIRDSGVHVDELGRKVTRDTKGAERYDWMKYILTMDRATSAKLSDERLQELTDIVQRVMSDEGYGEGVRSTVHFTHTDSGNTHIHLWSHLIQVDHAAKRLSLVKDMSSPGSYLSGLAERLNVALTAVGLPAVGDVVGDNGRSIYEDRRTSPEAKAVAAEAVRAAGATPSENLLDRSPGVIRAEQAEAQRAAGGAAPSGPDDGAPKPGPESSDQGAGEQSQSNDAQPDDEGDTDDADDHADSDHEDGHSHAGDDDYDDGRSGEWSRGAAGEEQQSSPPPSSEDRDATRRRLNNAALDRERAIKANATELLILQEAVGALDSHDQQQSIINGLTEERNRLEVALRSANESLRTTTEQLDGTSKALDERTKELETTTDQRDELLQQIGALSASLETSKESLADRDAEIAEALGMIADSGASIPDDADLVGAATALAESFGDITESLQSAQAEVARVELEQQTTLQMLAEQQQQNEMLTQSVVDLRGEVTEKDNVIEQHLASNKALSTQLDEVTEDRNLKATQNEGMTETIAALKESVASQRDEIERFREDIVEARKEMAGIRDELGDARKQLQAMRDEKVSLVASEAGLKSQLESLVAQMDTITAERVNMQQLIDSQAAAINQQQGASTATPGEQAGSADKLADDLLSDDGEAKPRGKNTDGPK